MSGSPRHSLRSRRSWSNEDAHDGGAKSSELRGFSTNFARALRDQNQALPPALLRAVQAPGPPQPPPKGPQAAPKLRVCVRVGGERGGDGSPGSPCVALDARRKQITLTEPKSANSSVSRSVRANVPKIFGFDSVFSADDGLAELCAASLGEALTTVSTGCGDAVILSLGAASPAKQASLLGDGAQLGLLPTAVAWLFRLIGDVRSREPDRRFSVRVSAVEVGGHNETLTDLLADLSDSDTNGGVRLTEDPVEGLRLTGAVELRVPNAEKAAHLLDAALAHRQQSKGIMLAI